jgi:hypothetical protein
MPRLAHVELFAAHLAHQQVHICRVFEQNLECQDDAERGIDLLNLIEGQMTDVLTKTTWIHCRGLFGQYAGHLAPQRDLRSEAGRPRGSGRWCYQPRG